MTRPAAALVGRPARSPRSAGETEISISRETVPVLGVGVDRDAAFCLSSGGRARLSPGFGDLATGLARRAYVEALERARQSHDIEPEAVSRDLDASSFAASLAAELELPAVAVQHHHAHAAAVMAEHGLEGRVLAVVLDEPGLGDDGTTWGGEFLVADAVEARRAGHLRAVPGPGSNGMGVVYAADAGVLRRAASMLGPNVTREPPTGGGAERTLPDTSAGGLFDAVASLAGLRGHHRGAGRGWVRLARAADGSATMEYPFDLGTDDGSLVLDTRPIVRAVVKDLGNGRSAGTVAGRFHRTMAAGILAICRLLRIDTGLDRVVLAGALFADGLLVSDTAARLATQGFHVYPPQRIPPGDASLALGQVLVASARLGRPAA